MRKNRNNFGFSLTEVLLALGTLSIGMIFVAEVFPVAIYFSTQATEQTIAAVVADEAFAKIRLYGESDPGYQNWLAQPPLGGCVDFNDVVALNPDEFAYPSDPTTDVLRRRYWWSALLRRVSPVRGEGPAPTGRLVQVTVFISRKISASTTYPDPAAPIGGQVLYPMPVEVGVVELVGGDVLRIDDTMKTFINDGYTIVHGPTGQLYRVLERRPSEDDTIVLDRDWIGAATDVVWVVPPPEGGGRYPCIAVYQKVIRF
jgi:type II secretory pathway pseudopilin PulG